MERLAAVTDLCLPHMSGTEQSVALFFLRISFSHQSDPSSDVRQTPERSALREVRQIMAGVLALVK